MDEQNVVYEYKEYFSAIKELSSDTCYNKNKFLKHYT